VSDKNHIVRVLGHLDDNKWKKSLKLYVQWIIGCLIRHTTKLGLVIGIFKMVEKINYQSWLTYEKSLTIIITLCFCSTHWSLLGQTTLLFNWELGFENVP